MQEYANILLLVTLAVALALGLHRVFRQVVFQVRSKAEEVRSSGGSKALITLKTLLSFLQLSNLMLDFNLQWPGMITGVFGAFGAASGSLVNAAFLSCLLKWNERHRHLVLILVPLLSICIPGIVVCVVKLLHRRKLAQWQRRESGSTEPRGDAPRLRLYGVPPDTLLSTVVLLLLYLSYPSVSRQALRSIVCTNIGGQPLLSFDLTVPCDNSHTPYRVFAWAQLALISLGLPILSSATLYYKRRVLHTEEVRRVYHFLYAGYRPSVYWFESARMLTKLALSAASTLLVDSSYGARAFFGLLTLLTGAGLQLQLQPYSSQTQGKLELASILLCFFYLLSGLFFAADSEHEWVAFLLVCAVVGAAVAFVGLCLYLIALDLWRSEQATRLARAMSASLGRHRRHTVQAFSKLVTEAMQERTLFGRFMAWSQHQSGPWSCNGSACRGGTTARGANEDEDPPLSTSSVTTNWEIYTTDEGDVYFYNRKTLETSWDKPDELTRIQAASEAAAEAWIMQASRSTGLRTYYNTVTMLRQDMRPTCMPLQRNECWSISKDPATGLPHFYNSFDQEATLVLPPDFVPTPEEAAQYGWFLDSMRMAQGGGEPSPASDNPMLAGDAESLVSSAAPEGWQREVTEEGWPYWHSEETGESFWEEDFFSVGPGGASAGGP